MSRVLFPWLHLSLIVLQQDSGVFSFAFLPVDLYHADFNQSDGSVTPQHFNYRKTQQKISAMSLAQLFKEWTLRVGYLNEVLLLRHSIDLRICLRVGHFMYINVFLGYDICLLDNVYSKQRLNIKIGEIEIGLDFGFAG